MSDRMTDERIIEACRQGDRAAFQTLFEAYKDRVYSIALHFSGNEASAKDITQQVFLKLFTRIEQFRHEAEFTTWLYRLVVRAHNIVDCFLIEAWLTTSWTLKSDFSVLNVSNLRRSRSLCGFDADAGYHFDDE